MALFDDPKGESFYDLARKRFDNAKTGWTSVRKEAEIDLKMASGDQWDAQVKANRDNSSRPALTFNQFQNLIQHISNQARQNKPAIHVNPVADGANQATAEVYEGIIRHIDYHSHGDVARDCALENAAACSIGPYRINTRFVDDSFDQEIVIERISDPLSVYIDPDAVEPDFSDMKFCFIRRRMSWDEYKKKYPKAAIQSFDPDGAGLGDWQTDEHIYVAEYFRTETEKRELVQLSEGTVGYKDELQIPEGVTVVQSREVNYPTIKWDVINGVESLESTDWVGKWIPILMVTGREMMVDGKRCLLSLIRFARDAQKLLNAALSGEAENIGLSTKAPWIGVKGQFKDKKWETSNQTLHSYLEIEPITIAGQPAPMPTRNQFEPPIQALSELAQQMVDRIKAAANIFDSSLGSASPEYSGVSVLRRNQQSDLTNYHFVDNLSRTMWHEGRILLDLIPKIYKPARAARILGENGDVKTALITQALYGEDGQQTVPTVPGFPVEQHHRIDVGRYDVTVTTGPSYTTRRQETFDMLTQFTQAMPQIMAVAGDIIFKNSDIPGAQEIAKRLKIMLPQPIQQAEAGDGQDPQQMAMQLAAAKAQMQQLAQQMQQLLMERKAKVLELLAKNWQVALQEETKLTLAELKAKVDQGQAMLNAEMAAIDKKLEMFYESELAPGPDTGNQGLHPEAIPQPAAPGSPAGGVQ